MPFLPCSTTALNGCVGEQTLGTRKAAASMNLMLLLAWLKAVFSSGAMLMSHPATARR
jgi:hypothetical protein